ncbi:MAG: ABC transporter ATP-binding protein/permease [Rhodobacteraceae bacterium]|nr:ABC transporter ATP-binding protein/permease [Paracoccaceae bacterium]
MSDAAHLLAAIRAEGRGRFWVALALLTAGSLSEGASILLVLPVLQLMGDAPAQSIDLAGRSLLGLPLPPVSLGLPAVLAALVALVAAAAACNRAKAVCLSDLMSDFANTLRTGLFSAIARARWEEIARHRAADLELALTAEAERVKAAAILVLTILQNLVMLAVYLALGLLVSVPMTLAILLAGGLALAALTPFRRAAAGYGARLRAAREAQFRSTADFLAGLKTARALDLGPAQAAAYARLLAEAKADAAAYARRSATGAGAFQVALAAGAAAFVLAATGWAGLSTGEVVVLLLLLMRLAPRFLGLQAQVQQLLVDLPAWRRAQALGAALAAAAEASPDPALPALPALTREIRLDRVTCRHAPGLAPALEDCTLRIRAGAITGIVGPSGAGKSTLADILAGLRQPERGLFLVDGRALAAADLPRWRARTAYLPQEAFLLHASVAENLRIVRPGASDADLRAALDQAAAEFVHDLPQGLDTPVGDRGARLSGGERQRIALARAFLRAPDLMILDEATSALDWESQQRVIAALRALAGRSTIVTIAHRPSMVAFAETIHILEAGRIVESGSREELTADPGGRLARMFRAEAEAGAEAGTAPAEPDPPRASAGGG